jgi:hypothetical protein
MKHLLVLPACLFFMAAGAQITFRKIDSTLKIGKAGYRVECQNKYILQNQLTVRPVGFTADARPINFPMAGRLYGAQIDDLNGDGYPDLVLFVYTDSNAVNGTVYGFLSSENKDIIPCILPDITMDGKMNAGYKGHDEFMLLEGAILRKFPIYKPGDDKNKPTGGKRVIEYKVARGDNGGYKFGITNLYDTK